MTALAEQSHLDHLTLDWIFKDEPPTTDQVVQRLMSLPPWFGVKPIDLFPFVQPLPQSKARLDPVTKKPVMVPDPANSRLQTKAMDTTFSLYMSVAGRETAIQRAAELNGWRVDFIPEPVTPTGIPGILIMDGPIVYRESCTIWVRMDDGSEVLLGSKPGMAWVPPPGEKRKQAAESAPFQKVETSARGRAIAAWGIGILPGSGVASLEEAQAAQQYEAEQERRAGQTPPGALPGSNDEMPSHDELVGHIRTAYETMRQLRGISEIEKVDAMLSYIHRAFGVEASDDKGGVDFTRLSPGQLVLMRNVAAQGVANLRAEETGL